MSESPNNGIYKYEGTMKVDNLDKPLSLGPESMLLRGSVLRNTDAAYGIVIFAGHETKVMQNSAKAEPKWSNLENKTNFSILIVLAFQFIVSCIAAFIGASWSYNNS